MTDANISAGGQQGGDTAARSIKSTDYARVSGGFAKGGEQEEGPLLRPEAVAAAAATGMGRPIAFLPVSWIVLSIGLLAFAAVFAAFLVAGNYSRNETAKGVVTSAGGQVRIVAPFPGTIGRIAAREGQPVRAGDLLLTVNTAKVGTDGNPADLKSVQSIDAEVASLVERLRGLDAAASIEIGGQLARLAMLKAQAQSYDEVEQDSRERLQLASDALKLIQPVAEKGFISADSMRRRRDEILSLRQSIAEARAQHSSLTGQAADLAAATRDRPYVLEQERGHLLDQIATAQREREALVAERGYIIKAPVDGFVTALQAAVGQTVDPQLTLLTVSANGGGASMAELYVPSRARGFIEPGQLVRVRYDAFPFEQFGSGKGVVTAISASVLKPQEIQAPLDIREPMYRVLVKLDGNGIGAYGKKYRVQPGSSLTADIILEKRNFWSWLLDPLLAHREGR
jgi:membrane fusion protein